MKRNVGWAAVVLVASTASAADYATSYTTAGQTGRAPTEYELKWDNGTLGSYEAWTSNGWGGNDFNVATLRSTHHYIRQIGVNLSAGGGTWEGIRLAVWSFPPGSIMWPESGTPYYVHPTGSAGWKWFDVNWVMPPSTTAVLAALEQYYNYPACDWHAWDTGPSQHHSWTYFGSAWSDPGNNANLMLRVRYSPDYGLAPVTPASWGRVKAFFY
jgi:hypothetical protein